MENDHHVSTPSTSGGAIHADGSPFEPGEEVSQEMLDGVVTVYDKTGMLYYGKYKNSLDTGFKLNRYSFRCLPYGREPIQIAFES